jgi:hypothetical protein
VTEALLHVIARHEKLCLNIRKKKINNYLCSKIETVAVFSFGATTFEMLNTPHPVTVAASPCTIDII